MFNKKIFSRFNLFLLFILFLITSPAAAQQQVRVGVMQFLSRTNEITANQAAQVTDVISRILSVSPSISVIERERLRVIAVEKGLNIDVSSQSSAMEIGRIAGCKYILLGSVTQITQRYLNRKSSSQFLFDTIYDGDNEMQEATASIEARLIDLDTGRVVLSFLKDGSAIISSDDAQSKRSLSELIMRAIHAAASRLGDKIREVLANEYPMVISVNKKNIRINRGRSSGVSNGALYRVYEDGEELFDLDGKSLGKRVKNIAVVRVVNTGDEFSSVEVFDPSASNSKSKKSDSGNSKKTAKTGKSNKKSAKGTGIDAAILVREKDKLEAITRTEADELIKKAKFPAKRS